MTLNKLLILLLVSCGYGQDTLNLNIVDKDKPCPKRNNSYDGGPDTSTFKVLGYVGGESCLTPHHEYIRVPTQPDSSSFRLVPVPSNRHMVGAASATDTSDLVYPDKKGKYLITTEPFGVEHYNINNPADTLAIDWDILKIMNIVKCKSHFDGMQFVTDSEILVVKFGLRSDEVIIGKRLKSEVK